MLAHHTYRVPRANNGGSLDIVNNVIYNAGTEAGKLDNKSNTITTGGGEFNYVGNYIKRGPDSDLFLLIQRWRAPPNRRPRCMSLGNIDNNRPNDSLAQNLVLDPSGRQYETGTRHDFPSVSTADAFTARDQVLADVGANKGLSCDGSVVLSTRLDRCADHQ